MQSSSGGSASHHPPAASESSSLDTSTGDYLGHDVMHSSSRLVGRNVDEGTLRRSYSVHSDRSSIHRRNGHDDPSLDRRQSLPLRRVYHDHERRDSVPTTSSWKNSPAGRRNFESSHGASSSVTRGYTNDRVDDLEAFRLARACGTPLDRAMTLLPPVVNGSHTIQHDELEEAFPHSLLDHELGVRAVRTERGESGTNERGRSKPRSSFEHSAPYDECIALTSYSVSISTRPKREAPPTVPNPDLVKQLAQINCLLSLHREAFFRSPLTLTEPVTIEGLIDTPRLMREHELDARLGNIRGKCERGYEGTTIPKKPENGQGDSDQKNGWQALMHTANMKETDYRVFGRPISVTRTYASRASSLAGYQLDLPIVVYACVEELYKTGMTVSGLFRSPPHVTRHNQLIDLFDNGPSFGLSETLSKERTEDICALLRSYIDRLPHPIWHESLFDPMLKLCVLSSVFPDPPSPGVVGNVEREDGAGRELRVPRARPTSLLVPGTPSSALNSIHTRSSSLGDITSFSGCRPSSALSTVIHNEIDFTKERPQILLAKAFFRLLPRSHLALLAYLCAFFSQLPLCPHNQFAIEDIARFFAVPLFLGKANGDGSASSEVQNKRKKEARMIMVWILRRWSHISEGLFDAEDADASSEDDLTSPSSSDDSESVRTSASDLMRHACANKPEADSQRRSGLLSGKVGEGILEWKGSVEQDVSELRRMLLVVQARLDF